MKDDLPSFRSLQDGLLVAPILQKLILNREPEKVLSWVESVSRWPFTRIIPSHFANNVKAGPTEFRKAFDFLFEEPKKKSSFLSFLFSDKGGKGLSAAFKEESKFLSDISQQLTKQGVLFPEAPLIERK